MNKINRSVVLRIALSFLVLYVLYAIHFILVKTVFEKSFSGNALEISKILSSFIWSFIGGGITAKIAKRSTKLSILVVAFLTVVFMLVNFPTNSGDVFYYLVNTVEMATGVIIGGFLVFRRTSRNERSD